MLASQILAQETKQKLWEIGVTKLGILSFVMPNIKHLAFFVDFILTLEWGHLNESVLAHTLKMALHTCTT